VKRWRKALYLWAIERKNILGAERLIYATGEEERLASGALFGSDAPYENSDALASELFGKVSQSTRPAADSLSRAPAFQKGVGSNLDDFD
jgi:hypothetical protein